jgi:chromosome segregation and condensation protein ScpB
MFTAATYAKVTGIRGKATYSTIHLLEKLALIEQSEEPVGRARAWRVCPRDGDENFGDLP